MHRLLLHSLLALSFLGCGEKETQSFEDFQADYFNARQGDELANACSTWYDDCVTAGYSEEDCGVRLEYCENGEWNTEEDREESDEEREEIECDDVATRVYEACLSEGGTEEDCRERAAQAYEDCDEREDDDDDEREDDDDEREDDDGRDD